MQSKLFVLMPRKWGATGGGRNFTGGRGPAPLEPPLLQNTILWQSSHKI